MSNITLTLLAFATLIIACAPDCPENRGAVTNTIVSLPAMCHEDESSGGGNSSDGSSDESTRGGSGSGSPTTDASTGGDDLCSSGETPEAGEAWGPCLDGACADGLLCIGNDVGGACISPGCVDACPSSVGECGKCDSTGACIAPCAVDDDCPFSGMFCDVIVPAFDSRCLWPE